MGAGINLFRQLFPEDYYAYQTATLISSKPTSKVIKDSNDETIATYPLGGDELRGLLKVENGQLVAYGDVKGSDGIIYRNFGAIDLGSLSWLYRGDNTFSVDVTNVVKYKRSGVINAITVYATTVVGGVADAKSGADKTISFYYLSPDQSNDYLYIKDTAFTDATALQTALDGVYLIYELATPTTASGTPFTNPMLCGSTEEFTDTRTIKMPCGHDSLYYTSNFKYW